MEQLLRWWILFFLWELMLLLPTPLVIFRVYHLLKYKMAKWIVTGCSRWIQYGYDGSTTLYKYCALCQTGYYHYGGTCATTCPPNFVNTIPSDLAYVKSNHFLFYLNHQFNSCRLELPCWIRPKWFYRKLYEMHRHRSVFLPQFHLCGRVPLPLYYWCWSDFLHTMSRQQILLQQNLRGFLSDCNIFKRNHIRMRTMCIRMWNLL